MLPGLVSLAFYRRRPSRSQIALGAGITAAASAALGAILPTGSLTRWESILLAVVGGLALFSAILAWLWYVYLPMRAARSSARGPSVPP